MKVAYIIPTLEAGGAELRAIERLNRLSSLYDLKIKLVVLSDRIELREQISEAVDLEVLKLKHIASFSRKAYLYSFMNSIVLRNALVKFCPDVIVASLPISHHISRLAILHLGKRIKLYNYHHATQYKENPIHTFFQRILHIQTRFLSRLVDYGHIFISKAVEEDISCYLTITNGQVLYNALPDMYDTVGGMISKLDKARFNIVIPGRLTSVKGHIPALESLLAFLQSTKNVLITIIGEGRERENIEKFIKNNDLESKVELLGGMSHLNILTYIRDCDLVLIPSLSEGLGNVAIESLMMGATTIVSDAGGLKEIVLDRYNGYVYDRRCPEQLVELVEGVYKKDLILDKVVIRQSYLDRFTLDNHVRDFYNIITR